MNAVNPTLVDKLVQAATTNPAESATSLGRGEQRHLLVWVNNKGHALFSFLSQI
ncbi:MAG: hypothetical protein JOZ39_11135 [Chloroflexi bacterium]|nr:hypothetical protein [Chloroflexota bacterium]